eukprot:6042872-Pyramimonas_sp.AAC.1
MALKALESDPLMMTFGSGDAFPSTCRDFLPQVLRHGGCPRSVLNVVDAIYVSPLAWINLSGTMQVFCRLASSIQQGCPIVWG